MNSEMKEKFRYLISNCIRDNPETFEKTDEEILHNLLDDEDVNLTFDTEQNPVFHPEENVGNHTYLMIEYLYSTGAINRVRLFGAFFHDIGKGRCTSPSPATLRAHPSVGAEMTAKILSASLEDTSENRVFIQQICMIVKKHMPIKGVMETRPSKVDKIISLDIFEDLRQVAVADEISRGVDITRVYWNVLLLLRMKYIRQYDEREE